ncbi:hypothetical protein LOZ66_006544 [Ophidiomyces ophidiicola]|nr:hypothetical protein LOZ66_006544 [Ophidiomyces ophidiicola]
MGFIKTLIVTFAVLLATDAASLIDIANKKDIIPDSYIVVMKESVSPSSFDTHITWATNVHNGTIAKRGSTAAGGMKYVYRINGWHGYSGSFDRETLNKILQNADVDYVEPDRRVQLATWVRQRNAPSWGLPRISHRERGSSDFIYDDSAGRDITIYGVDTGIDILLPEFAGRATWGANFAGGPNKDEHGHGTHTAGTFAGTRYGIAKRSTIVAVKVLDRNGSGTWAGIIQGISWCVDHARRTGTLGRAVINLSLGGGRMNSANQAATRAQDAGMFLAVAAGNSNADATNTSPASAARVCTVAASTDQDTKASFSNWGAPINLYAPGTNITSVLPGGMPGSMSGTSMAAPHVAGVGAAIMALHRIPPSAVCARLIQMAEGRIRNPGAGTTNKLLYNGSGS